MRRAKKRKGTRTEKFWDDGRKQKAEKVQNTTWVTTKTNKGRGATERGTSRDGCRGEKLGGASGT